jgi:hypothetical protein
MIGHRRSPTTSKYHHHGSGFHVSPVEPSARSDERSVAVTGSVPAGISARIAVGATPSTVTRCRSTISHSRPGPG